MRENDVQIRGLSLLELKTVLGWAEREGWNPGLSDAEAFYNSDPGGFFGAFAGGRLAGAISAVRYGDEFAFVGLFIVRPELRGGPLGPLLGRKALERLQNVNVGVDGVEKKIKNYETCGFKMAHRNVRMEGVSFKTRRAASDALKPLSEIPFAKLLAYDAGRFPARREAFLKQWIGAPGHRGLAFVDSQGGVQGYGVLRPCVKGFKAGPLFAKDSVVARSVLEGLLSGAPEGAQFQLDAPESNEAALALASEMGLKSVFKTARMYNVKRPEIAEREIFGITSFELG